jgi:hypothetical protein
MTAKNGKFAQLKLVHVEFEHNIPPYETEVMLFSWEGKVFAGRKGIDKSGMPLGKFYKTTAEGIYLRRVFDIHPIKLETLDGAVIKHGRRRGGPQRMGGHSLWTKIWFVDGKVEEFWD